MAVKVKPLEIVRDRKTFDAGAKSERIEDTQHIWVQMTVMPKFKINAAKLSTAQMNQLEEAIASGSLAWMELVPQLQQGGHAYYFKEGSEIEIVPAPAVQRPTAVPPPAVQPAAKV